MAIYSKRIIETRLQELDDYYLKLREALKGQIPSDLWVGRYGSNKEELMEDYVSVNFDDVLLRVEHFRVEVTAIKALKTKAAKPRSL